MSKFKIYDEDAKEFSSDKYDTFEEAKREVFKWSKEVNSLKVSICEYNEDGILVDETRYNFYDIEE